ncbi:hypothetical protein [Aquipuribacter nitratireducens]|uniref:DUF7847 domain-containing protein n=1 Tax=Aquipuribacter nitratireducens TaxID=650104 RepID=A0ABW0GL89_9MICO
MSVVAVAGTGTTTGRDRVSTPAPGGTGPDDRPPAGGWVTPETASPWTPAAPPPQPGPPPPQDQRGVGGWTDVQRRQGQQPYGSVLTRRGIVPLRPLGFSDFFDGSFRAIRHNPAVMLGLTAIVLTVTNVLVALPLGGLVSLPTFTDPDAPASGDDAVAALGVFAALVPAGFIQSVALVVLTGLLILSVTQSAVDRKLSAGELWQRARGRVLVLVGWSLLLSLGGSLLVATALAPGITLLVLEQVAGGVVSLVVLGIGVAVLSVWLAVRLVYVPVVLVVERARLVDAVRRSWHLTRGAFWRTFGVLLLALLLTQAVSSLLAAPFSVVAGLGLALAPSPAVGAVLYVGGVALGSTVATVVVVPYLAAVTALLYVDRRMRLEGLDVALSRVLADERA